MLRSKRNRILYKVQVYVHNTKTQCDSVVAIIEEMKADVENLTKELYTVEKEYQSIYDDYQKGLSEINKCKKTHAKILDTYSLIHMLKSKLVDVDIDFRS